LVQGQKLTPGDIADLRKLLDDLEGAARASSRSTNSADDTHATPRKE
jgi:hypothetical protein